jgi:hypothetical protein
MVACILGMQGWPDTGDQPVCCSTPRKQRTEPARSPQGLLKQHWRRLQGWSRLGAKSLEALGLPAKERRKPVREGAILHCDLGSIVTCMTLLKPTKPWSKSVNFNICKSYFNKSDSFIKEASHRLGGKITYLHCMCVCVCIIYIYSYINGGDTERAFHH